MTDKAFKTCRLCETSWPTLADFVKDRKLRVNGYQASFGAPEDGVILLTHDVPGCGTTLGLVAGTLRNLHEGPRYVEVLAGTQACELWCLDEHSIEDCDAPCAMAWIRHVLQYLRRHELPEHLRKEQS